LRVVPVGDERRAVQCSARPEADASRDEVAGIADRPRERQGREVGRGGRVNEAQHGLDCGHARADEDGRHDREACASLGDPRAQSERDAQGHGRQGVAEVVDQVGQQGDASAGKEYDRLSDRCEAEHC